MKAAFTIVAKNYLAFSLTLIDSIKKSDPGLDTYIYIVDDVSDIDPGIIERYNINVVDDNIVPSYRSMAFKYSVTEYSTAVKPFIFKHLFDQYDRIMYVDPDIYFYQSADIIYEYLDQKNIILTPHILLPEQKYSGNTDDSEFLFAGIFNLGFIALKKSQVVEKLLLWWMDRLEFLCYGDRMQSLHVDQKWIDFVPAFFPEDLSVCRHPGLNIAYWNIHERQLNINDKNVNVSLKGDSSSWPLVFLHFSGLNPLNIYLNKQCRNIDVKKYPVWLKLIEEYACLVLQNDFEKYIQLRYTYHTFLNGDVISPLHRRLYRRLVDLGKINHSVDPFLVIEGSFHSKLSTYKLLTGKEKPGVDIGDYGQSKSLKLFKFILFILRNTKRILGIKRYATLTRMLQKLFVNENQVYLMKEFQDDFINYYSSKYF
jgi:hypothetical protein